MSGAPLRTSVVSMTTMLRQTTTATPATDVLRLLLDDVLVSLGEDDRYSSTTPAGRTLVSLATLARRAAGALCLGPGTALAGGSGLVVRRDLAAAARLLGDAATSSDGESWEIADLLVRAERLQAQWVEMLATGRR
jgi:hypothetical protein